MTCQPHPPPLCSQSPALRTRRKETLPGRPGGKLEEELLETHNLQTHNLIDTSLLL